MMRPDPHAIETELFARAFPARFAGGQSIRTYSVVPLRRSWPGLEVALGRRAPPSMFWRELVDVAPMLKPFDLGGRLSWLRISARCKLILDQHATWSSALGANVAAVEDVRRVAGEVLATIDHVVRPDHSAGCEYLWPNIGHCALCWRLVPRGGARSGFKHKIVMPDGHLLSAAAGIRLMIQRASRDRLLCARHSPRLDRAAYDADRERDAEIVLETRWNTPKMRARWFPIQVHLAETLMVNAQAIGPTVAAPSRFAWQHVVAYSLPLTAASHPLVVKGLREAFDELSGLPLDARNKLWNSIGDCSDYAVPIIGAMLITHEKVMIHDAERAARRTVTRSRTALSLNPSSRCNGDRSAGDAVNGAAVNGNVCVG